MLAKLTRCLRDVAAKRPTQQIGRVDLERIEQRRHDLGHSRTVSGVSPLDLPISAGCQSEWTRRAVESRATELRVPIIHCPAEALAKEQRSFYADRRQLERPTTPPFVGIGLNFCWCSKSFADHQVV